MEYVVILVLLICLAVAFGKIRQKIVTIEQLREKVTELESLLDSPLTLSVVIYEKNNFDPKGTSQVVLGKVLMNRRTGSVVAPENLADRKLWVGAKHLLPRNTLRSPFYRVVDQVDMMVIRMLSQNYHLD